MMIRKAYTLFKHSESQQVENMILYFVSIIPDTQQTNSCFLSFSFPFQLFLLIQNSGESSSFKTSFNFNVSVNLQNLTIQNLICISATISDRIANVEMPSQAINDQTSEATKCVQITNRVYNFLFTIHFLFLYSNISSESMYLTSCLRFFND